MERALYDPDAGYYTKNIKTVGGASADFATSATLDPGFAIAITNWIKSESADTGKKLRGTMALDRTRRWKRTSDLRNSERAGPVDAEAHALPHR